MRSALYAPCSTSGTAAEVPPLTFTHLYYLTRVGSPLTCQWLWGTWVKGQVKTSAAESLANCKVRVNVKDCLTCIETSNLGLELKVLIHRCRHMWHTGRFLKLKLQVNAEFTSLMFLTVCVSSLSINSPKMTAVHPLLLAPLHKKYALKQAVAEMSLMWCHKGRQYPTISPS